MKKRHYFQLVLALAALFSCRSSVNYKVAWKPETSGKYTYTIDNGIAVIDSIGYAPLNEKITVKDKNGKLMGLAGCTSESGSYNIIRYVYNNSDQELRGLISTYAEEEVSTYSDKDETSTVEDCHYTLKNLVINRILGNDLPDSITTWFDFKREDGYIVEVYDHTSDTLSIKAGPGNHIEYEVEECDEFWASDMFGGDVVVLFHIVPNNTNIESYTIDTYSGYNLQMKSTFKNQILCERKVFWYKEGHRWCAVGKMRVNGNEHIYEYINSCKSANEYIYENGVLKHINFKSQYGTILEQDTYFLSQDQEAYIHFHKKYDYKSKKLVRTDEERIEKNTFLSENSETTALNMDCELFEGWGGAYFSKSVIANGK